MISDIDRPQHLGTGTHHDIVSQGGMPLTLILSGSAQGNTLIQQAVVTDHCGFADYNAHSVINKQALSDLRTGMDFNSGFMARAL